MKKIVGDFISSILAGASISLGCMAFLTINYKIIGAIFFTTGLFLVLSKQYNLYTGKIANLVDENLLYTLHLILMWFGNLVGAAIMAGLTKITRLSALSIDALQIVNDKVSQGNLSAFVMAALCGMTIYLAVDNYNRNKTNIGKHLGLILLIPLFILCGFEHCIANMYYIFLSGNTSREVTMFALVVTAGNSMGAIMVKILDKIVKKTNGQA